MRDKNANKYLNSDFILYLFKLFTLYYTKKLNYHVYCIAK